MELLGVNIGIVGRRKIIRKVKILSIYSSRKAKNATICGALGNAEHSVRRPAIKVPKFQGFEAFWTAKNTQKSFKKSLAFHMQYVYNSKAC